MKKKVMKMLVFVMVFSVIGMSYGAYVDGTVMSENFDSTAAGATSVPAGWTTSGSSTYNGVISGVSASGSNSLQIRDSSYGRAHALSPALSGLSDAAGFGVEFNFQVVKYAASAGYECNNYQFLQILHQSYGIYYGKMTLNYEDGSLKLKANGETSPIASLNFDQFYNILLKYQNNAYDVYLDGVQVGSGVNGGAKLSHLAGG